MLMVDYYGEVVVGDYRARIPVSWVEENKNCNSPANWISHASVQSSEFSEEHVA